MKRMLFLLSLWIGGQSGICQSKSLLRYIKHLHTPRNMGYQAQWSYGSVGYEMHPKKIELRNGECYVRTNRTDIKIEAQHKSFKYILEPGSTKTDLNICNFYKEDSMVYITIFKGSALLHFKHWKFLLHAGQFAILTDTLKVNNLTKYELKSSIDRSWTHKDGYYQYYNKPVTMLINRIARSHGYAVCYRRKLQGLVSGETCFQKWADIMYQLGPLMELVPFTCSFKDDTLYID